MSALQELISLADGVFESADMGEIEIISSEGWDASDGKDLIKCAYYEIRGEENESSSKGSFHVKFDENGMVSDAYMLDVGTGNEVWLMDKGTFLA